MENPTAKSSNGSTPTLRPRTRHGKSKPGQPTWKSGDRIAMPKSLSGFAEYVGQHSKTREDIKTWFDALDLDDFVSFGGEP